MDFCSLCKEGFTLLQSAGTCASATGRGEGCYPARPEGPQADTMVLPQEMDPGDAETVWVLDGLSTCVQS